MKLLADLRDYVAELRGENATGCNPDYLRRDVIKRLESIIEAFDAEAVAEKYPDLNLESDGRFKLMIREKKVTLGSPIQFIKHGRHYVGTITAAESIGKGQIEVLITLGGIPMVAAVLKGEAN